MDNSAAEVAATAAAAAFSPRAMLSLSDTRLLADPRHLERAILTITLYVSVEIEYILRPSKCFDLGYSPPDDLCAPGVCDAWCTAGVQDEESAVETREAEEKGRHGRRRTKVGRASQYPFIRSPRPPSLELLRFGCKHTCLLAYLAGQSSRGQKRTPTYLGSVCE